MYVCLYLLNERDCTNLLLDVCGICVKCTKYENCAICTGFILHGFHIAQVSYCTGFVFYAFYAFKSL